MRIGFLYNRIVWNVAYRAESVAGALQRQGHDVTVAVRDISGTFDPRPLHSCDVVHIYRMADEPMRQCVDDFRRRGIAVTWDNDDDIRLVPEVFDRVLKTTPYQRERLHNDQAKMLQRVDLATTTSEHLVQVFHAAGAPHVIRIENYLFPTQYREPLPSRDGVLVGWVAGREHEACDQSLGVSKILGAALDRHPNLRLMTIGAGLALRSDRYEHHARPIPLADLNDHVRTFDIGIAPLGDLPMSYSRSNVKIKEYSAAGVPWIASARGPYLGLGSKQGGMVVGDDEWPKALDALIHSRFKRYRLRRRASAWAKTQSVDRHVDKWLAAFEQAIELARERRVARRSARPASAAG